MRPRRAAISRQDPSARELAHELDGHWFGAYGTAPCPACQPERRRDQAALSIGSGQDGRLLLHCHKRGCGFAEILHAAGIAPNVIAAGSPSAARALTADRLGWADDGFTTFVLGTGRVIGGQPVHLALDSPPAIAAAMTEGGSAGGWRRGVSALATGNPLVMVAICAALAGPLLGPLDFDGGGLHFRGASWRVMSKLLRAAASVWGGPGGAGRPGKPRGGG